MGNLVPRATDTITKRYTAVGSLGTDISATLYGIRGCAIHVEGSTHVASVEGTLADTGSADAHITSDGTSILLDREYAAGQVILTMKTPTANGSTKTLTGDFASDANWTKGTGWTIAGGVAVGATGNASNLAETASTVVSTETYLLTYTIKTVTTAGTLTPTAGGQTLTARVSTATTATPATYTEEFTATSTAALTFGKDATWAGTIDDVSLCKVTPINVSLIAWR